jgi:hypothetical protein
MIALPRYTLASTDVTLTLTDASALMFAPVAAVILKST